MLKPPLPRERFSTPTHLRHSKGPLVVSPQSPRQGLAAGAGRKLADPIPYTPARKCLAPLARRSRMISRAALWPGAPVTPPPGWVAEPHM